MKSITRSCQSPVRSCEQKGAPVEQLGLCLAAKELFLTKEVASAIGRSTHFVRELIDYGRLEAHRDSAFGTRASSAVTRRSVILYLIETTNAAESLRVVAIESLLPKLTPSALNRLIVKATRLRNQIR